MPEAFVRPVLSIVVPVVIFGIGALATFVFVLNRGLVQLEPAAGRTAPAGIIWVTAVLCAAFSAAAAYALFFTEAGHDPEQVEPLRWLIGGFGLGSILMFAATLHRWRWDHEGIEFRGALRSVKMAWTDLDRAGRSWQGGWFVRDRDHRRIYWFDDYTIGGDVIIAAVAHYRPDLLSA